ncbi:hypothetical protein B4Q13_16000 [Lacticaseibacillus rhamnosus]
MPAPISTTSVARARQAGRLADELGHRHGRVGGVTGPGPGVAEHLVAEAERGHVRAGGHDHAGQAGFLGLAPARHAKAPLVEIGRLGRDRQLVALRIEIRQARRGDAHLVGDAAFPQQVEAGDAVSRADRAHRAGAAAAGVSVTNGPGA